MDQCRHPLVAFFCEHVGKPWPEWGQAGPTRLCFSAQRASPRCVALVLDVQDDVEPGEAVAHQLQRHSMAQLCIFSLLSKSQQCDTAKGVPVSSVRLAGSYQVGDAGHRAGKGKGTFMAFQYIS